jgi:hypothetical protein
VEQLRQQLEAHQQPSIAVDTSPSSARAEELAQQQQVLEQEVSILKEQLQAAQADLAAARAAEAELQAALHQAQVAAEAARQAQSSAVAGKGMEYHCCRRLLCCAGYRYRVRQLPMLM